MEENTVEITYRFVRGPYDSMTPFYQWHEVVSVGDVMAGTRCGIFYKFLGSSNTFVDEDTCALTGGDRCTSGCIVPKETV